MIFFTFAREGCNLCPSSLKMEAKGWRAIGPPRRSKCLAATCQSLFYSATEKVYFISFVPPK